MAQGIVRNASERNVMEQCRASQEPPNNRTHPVSCLSENETPSSWTFAHVLRCRQERSSAFLHRGKERGNSLPCGFARVLTVLLFFHKVMLKRSRMNGRHAYRNNLGSPRSWTHVAMPCFSWSRFGGGNDPSVVELFPSGYVDRKFIQCSHCFHSVSD